MFKGIPAARRVLKILAHALIVSVTVTIIAFALMRLTPGDPVLVLLGEQATPDAAEKLRETLGLNGTLIEQFARYVGGILHGDLGQSITYGVSVTDLIVKAMPVTLGLMAMTTVIAVILTIPIAVYGALHPRGWFNRFFMVGSSLFISIPSFFLGLVAILLLSFGLQIAPVAGIGSGFFDVLHHLWLPSLIICASLVPVMARVLRSSILSTMREEFVEVAIVRGIDRWRFIGRYLLRPSIAPTISLLSYIVGSMFAAAVVIELVFNLPGAGTLLVAAVNSRDYPIVQGVTLVSGVLVVIIKTVGDLVTAMIDPRTNTE